MRYDLLQKKHAGVKRDYLERVNNPDFPKWKCAELASSFGYEYWDGDRAINYGGYRYREGYWDDLITDFSRVFNLGKKDFRVLDVGCGKGFLIHDLVNRLDCTGAGVDISDYAISNTLQNDRIRYCLSCASSLPFADEEFDFVYSLNTLHNLRIDLLFKAIREIERVSRGRSYICVESFRTEREKMNLLYWQVTCNSFYSVESWEYIFELCGYTGDYGFIFFE